MRRPPFLIVIGALGLAVSSVGCGRHDELASKAGAPSASSTSSAASSSSAALPSGKRSVTVEGASITVPEQFVALDKDKTARLRQASLAQEPSATITVNAVSDPGGLKGGMAYALRSEIPNADSRFRGSVRDALERLSSEIVLLLEVTGLPISAQNISCEADSCRVRLTVTMSMGDETADMYLDVTSYVPSEGPKRVVAVSTACTERHGVNACAPIMASSHFDLGPRLAFDVALSPPVDLDRAFAGFRVGETPAELSDTCKKLHMTPLDVKKEPPDVRAKLAADELAGCVGSAAMPAGNIGSVKMQVVGGHAVSIDLDVDATPEKLAAFLEDTFKKPVTTHDGMHIVSPAAKPGELFAIRVGAPAGAASGGILELMTREVWEHLRAPAPGNEARHGD